MTICNSSKYTILKLNRYHVFSFQIRNSKNDFSTLAEINKHSTDDLVTFDEEKHKYFYQGKSMDYSVTELIERYFHKIESNKLAATFMKGKNWPDSKYTHPDGTLFTLEEVVSNWEEIGLDSRTKGSLMHYNIESWVNKLPSDTDTPEMQQFLEFYQSFQNQYNITPYRTEWRIVAPDIKVGGSIDFLGQLPDSKYILLDWKRSKNLPTSGKVSYGKFCRYPLSFLPDTLENKYFLQLNFYAYMLKTYYGITVSLMYLCCFHPDFKEPFIVKVPLQERLVKSIVADFQKKPPPKFSKKLI